MPKAILAQRIYLNSNDTGLEKRLLKELTYFIPKYRDDLPPEVICNLRIIDEKNLSIPSGRTDLIPEGYEIIDKRVYAPVDWPEFNFTLRPEQQEIHDQVDDSCLINANPAWGKTFTGIAIARKLRQKTLVVVHTQALRDQWAEEVYKTLKIDPGIVGGTKSNFEGPIVIANVQKLNNIESTIYNKRFGTVIMDESHHVPATIFSNIIDRMHARYKIGLTASKRRKDGRHVIFQDYFSKNNFIADNSNSMTPVVHRLQLPIVVKDGGDSWALRVNELTANPSYQKYIATIASAYAQKGHKVLVIASRTDLLIAAKILTDRSVCITGEIKDTEDRKKLVNKILSGEADVLYGSQNIFSEGISINPLSCLILATPINNDPLLEQLIGRVTRMMPGKRQPVIVDIRLAGNTVFNQGQLRDGYYLNMGYEIIDV